MEVRHASDSTTGSGQDVISVAGESVRPRVGDLQGRAFQFNPPTLIRWYTYLRDKVNLLIPSHSTGLSTRVKLDAHSGSL